jgi:hypothetical protein
MLLPFCPNNHYNKFGFYSVGNFRVYSKYESLKLAKHMLLKAQFNFNDDVFAAFDWYHEPSQSLDELYCKRAQQIREKYDYLVMMYSGGADSYQALMSFVKNHIYLDEIAYITVVNSESSLNSWGNSEITKVAYPTAEDLIHRYRLTTKHRQIDLTNQILNLHEHVSDEEWIYYLRYHFGPINLARSFIRESVPHYQKLIDSGKKVCLIWGADKPQILGLSNRDTGEFQHAVAFSDRTDGQVTTRQKYLGRSWEHDEFFYWSADLPALVSKQAHVLKKYMHLNQDNPAIWHDGNETKELGMMPDNHGWKYLRLDAALGTIYPDWNINTFSVGKPLSCILSTRDKWLLKDPVQYKTAATYYAGLRRLQQLPEWRDLRTGLGAMWSKVYPLSPISSNQQWDIIYPY